MADEPGGRSLLDELTHWTGVIGQAQLVMMEHGATAALKAADDMAALARDAAPAADALWAQGLDAWRALLPAVAADPRDRRFAAPEWQQPLFDLMRQGYAAVSEQLLRTVAEADGLEPRQREQLAFATRAMVDAMSPANFPLTNPQVIARTLETRGANLVTGLERMLKDASAGQLRHVAEGAFEVGRNVAATPGKVIFETELFQLIHYAPTTEAVQATPLVIFPPWINRFYILDLSPAKSFVGWARDQGLSVFMVSWKSADAAIAHVQMDDYVLRGEWLAVETVCRLLDVPAAHVVGYCVAGTALAMLLAWAAATGNAGRIASATFFTAQVDFADAGELRHFVDDGQLRMLAQLSGQAGGTVDGRYLAAAFNALRGRDLIWSYVVNNYLLAEDYLPFDLLHWNGDVADLPGGWHQRYLTDFYRDNLLVEAGRLSVDGVPVDLGRVETRAYVQAGREDHIAPPESVWKLTHHFRGPLRFVLAGSGHIAGVVNPPAANKYGYWLNDAAVDTLPDFIAGATEHKGSWWPHWLAWLTERSGGEVPATGARRPGEGALPAIEDAPGRYVRTR